MPDPLPDPPLADPPSVEDVGNSLRAVGCVFAEDEARLLLDAADSPDQLTALVAQRVAGMPLEHLLGWAEFAGNRVHVGPGVFVPRRRTELLLRQAKALLAMVTPRCVPPIVVELCCGCAAIGAVLSLTAGPLELHAADIDPVAAGYARRNLSPSAGQVHVGDLDAPLPARLRGRVELMIANAPYVPTDAIALMPPEARLHEPTVALDGGRDGLDVLRRVLALAPRWLVVGGHLLVEINDQQGPPLIDAALRAGMQPEILHSDELGATALMARMPRT